MAPSHGPLTFSYMLNEWGHADYLICNRLPLILQHLALSCFAQSTNCCLRTVSGLVILCIICPLPLEHKLQASRIPGCHRTLNGQCLWVTCFGKQVLRFIGAESGGRRQGESLEPNAGLMPKQGERKGRKVRVEDSQATVQLWGSLGQVPGSPFEDPCLLQEWVGTCVSALLSHWPGWVQLQGWWPGCEHGSGPRRRPPHSRRSKQPLPRVGIAWNNAQSLHRCVLKNERMESFHK